MRPKCKHRRDSSIPPRRLDRQIDHRAMSKVNTVEHTNRQMYRTRRQYHLLQTFESLPTTGHSAKLGTASCTGSSRFSISGSVSA